MTAAVELQAAHDLALAVVSLHDRRRDQFERRDRVRVLTNQGCSAEEIAREVGLSSRHVVRLRSAPPPPEPVRLPAAAEITDQRADDMEGLAAFAMTLVGELRDENPAQVWAALSLLPRHALQELAVVALAMVPIESTRDELLAWVLDLPAAREVSR